MPNNSVEDVIKEWRYNQSCLALRQNKNKNESEDDKIVKKRD